MTQMIPRPTYVEVIAEDYPLIQVAAVGDGSDYEYLKWVSGDPLPSKADLDAKMASKIKERMWKVIQAERDRRTQGGVKVAGSWFHSDQPSRIQQIGLVIFGANMPAGIMWKTMSGTFVPMTPQLALGIFQSVAMSDQVIYGTAEQKKAQMLASADPISFNYLTGWPAIYGE